jgi:hypothetical protein
MSIVARFVFDVAFAQKGKVFEIYEKYTPMARDLGFPEGRLLVGSIGAPESRVVEEYVFENLAALEAAWDKLNDPRMASWQEEMRPHIVPGSHRWEVYRVQKSTF